MCTTASLSVSFALGHREHSKLNPPCSFVLCLLNWSCWGVPQMGGFWNLPKSCHSWLPPGFPNEWVFKGSKKWLDSSTRQWLCSTKQINWYNARRKQEMIGPSVKKPRKWWWVLMDHQGDRAVVHDFSIGVLIIPSALQELTLCLSGQNLPSPHMKQAQKTVA